MMAHELLRSIAAAIQARRCVLVTSETTGNPLLEDVSIGGFDMMASLRYSDAMPEGSGSLGYRTIDRVAEEVRRLGQFDVAFVDPFHSYEASLTAFNSLVGCTRERGWMVVHDCLPPYLLASDVYQNGPWCGSTYAAFRDVASTSGRAWFVVDSDFGLGVLGPAQTSRLVQDSVPPEVVTRWNTADIESKRELLRDCGKALMRAIPAERFDELFSAILRNEPVTL